MINECTQADVLIIGGGLGGVAAARAALILGKSVVLSEAGDWLGGQLTSQGVPPDEHPWIETDLTSAGYRELRNRIRDYYRRNYPLTEPSTQRRPAQPRTWLRLRTLPRAAGRRRRPGRNAFALDLQRTAYSPVWTSAGRRDP